MSLSLVEIGENLYVRLLRPFSCVAAWIGPLVGMIVVENGRESEAGCSWELILSIK